MDTMRSFGSDFGDAEDERTEDEGVEAPPQIGTDERRMHVRAYNFWAHLLRDRSYPSIDDLDVAKLSDFGPHSVLLDFTSGIDNPAISFVGDALREECALPQEIGHISDVPGRSLLSRLTDHYLQIIANQAPIGFEAEFVNDRGFNILYRGILLPFSSNDDTIDFILGVMNWKEVADEALTERLQAEVEHSIRHAAQPSAVVPGWADGPDSSRFGDGSVEEDTVLDLSSDMVAPESGSDPDDAPGEDAGLADWLSAARASAESAKDARVRSRAALYAAVSRAYDFSLAAVRRPAEYRELLDDAGLTLQNRSPMTPIVKLVFGVDYDKTRLTEYAAALSHGHEKGLGRGALRDYLEGYDGGLKGLVRDVRAERRPGGRTAQEKLDEAIARLRAARALGFADDEAASDEEFVLMIGRRTEDGRVAVLGAIDDRALLKRAIVKAKPSH